MSAPLLITIGRGLSSDWWPLRMAQLRAFLVAAARTTLLACVLMSLGVVGTLPASAAGVGYTYDASTSVYDGAVHSAQANTSGVAPVVSLGVSDGVRGTVATVIGSLAVVLRLSVAANSSAEVLATPQVASPRLQNIVNDLYKGTTNPGRVGNGTTMDAIANELRTGLPTEGKFHSIKGQDYLNGLNNWLERKGVVQAPVTPGLTCRRALLEGCHGLWGRVGPDRDASARGKARAPRRV